MECTSGAPSTVSEVAAEKPFEVEQSAVVDDQTLTLLPGDGKSAVLQSNGDFLSGGGTGFSSCGDALFSTDLTNGAPSVAHEVAVEESSEADQSAVGVNQTLTPLQEDGKGTVLESKEDGDGEETTMQCATELFERGSRDIEDENFVEAVDSLSRALEIRVAKYGELAPECISFYYKYGCALLCKVQEETHPLGDIHKNTPKNSAKDTSVNNVEDGEGSMTSSTLNKHDSSANTDDLEVGSGDKNEEDVNEECEEDDEELGEAEEEDSDLDLAWKMLDIARAIVEKNPEDSLEKVNVFAALGEISMEREDVEASLSDYRRALAILERLVEPDSRRVIELNYRICLLLDMWSKIEEAILYCEKAISLCKSRLEHVRIDAAAKSKDSKGAAEKSISDLDKTAPELSPEPSKKLDDEVYLLDGILTDLEEKLEDLQQQLISNPKSILIEHLKKKISSSPAADKQGPSDFSRSLSINSSQMAVVETAGFDSPSVSTAANDPVQHLGVVGRGIKRATVSPTGAEPPPKKLLADFSAEKAENCISDPPSSESSIK